MQIKHITTEIEQQVIGWRRYFHQHPELSYHEVKTSQEIRRILASFGKIEISQPINNSVVGVLKGDFPGKTIALRADIDALPIKEEADVTFPSLNEGTMHACGHDAHIAMLLGAASILASMQNQIHGKIKFIFQPAEEQAPGGASVMVKAGVLNDVDMIFGQHISIVQDIPVGQIIIKPDTFMAGCDAIDLTITGKGTHSSTPEKGNSPILAAAEVVTDLNQIVTGLLPATEQAVIAIGSLQSGKVDNVIPETARILGTARFMTPEVRLELKQAIERVIEHNCAMHQTKADLSYILGLGPIINDLQATDIVKKAAKKVIGADNILTHEPIMSSDDFASYLEEKPGAFFLLGAGKTEDGFGYMNHHAKFNIDERALKYGTSLNVEIALKALNTPSTTS
ncbi:MAG TPA: amidohydrolase [Tetragenococcus sp.]|nr:amidohydrolase [Tetragenococcus sp.]